MSERLLLITGSSGVGKTSVLRKSIDTLKVCGYCVGGMISYEVRKNGKRVGFETQDLNNEERGWLAHVDQRGGPRIGKYRVNLENLDAIGAASIIHAVKNAHVIVVDEIGPMELYSRRFREAVNKALQSKKLVISTVHRKMDHKLIGKIRTRKDAVTFLVTRENRETLHLNIAEKAKSFLSRHASEQKIEIGEK